MFDLEAKTKIDQADLLYYKAEEELSRPEEDVVPHMVCENAYQSVNKYLVGYLINHGVKVDDSMSLKQLAEQCKKINTGFNGLGLDKMYNAKEPEDVWMDLDITQSYFKLAKETRSIVKRVED